MIRKTASLFTVSLLLFLAIKSFAQVYYPVTHLSGAQAIGGRVVTVTPINNPSSGFSCVGPYSIGSGSPTGYMFSFSKAVDQVMVNMQSVSPNDIVSIYVNGTHYSLNSSNLGPFIPATCASGTVYIDANGDLQGNGNTQLHFFSVSIDSIRVIGPAGFSGMIFDFKFAGDTLVTIKEPMQDTLLCSLDSIKLTFTTMGRFKSNNVFTAQLSNAAGSFATPISIGTRAADTTDTIKCQIPVNTPTGTGYKLRIISTNPIDTSDINIKNIAIGNAPPANLNATANTPVCSGTTLNLTANTTGSGYNWSWAGPLSYTSNLQNPSISNVATNQSGDYIVTGRLHGCVGKDTVTVTVNQSPAAITAGSNSAICEGGTLSLTTTSGGAGATYSWAGPASYTAGVQNPLRVSTTTAHSGDYIVTATLNNCDAKDTVTVLVKPMPAVPTASNNGPLCPGDSLGLAGASTTSGVSYSWIGPSSFSSSLQNPYILNVTSSHSGVYSLTTSLSGCSTSAQTTVVIKPVPAMPTANSNSPVCAGGSLNLNANSITGGVSYNWNGPNGYVSTIQNPTINPAGLSDAGNYTVTATLNGCTSAAGNTSVIINNIASLGAYPSPNDTVCQMNPAASLVAVPFNGGSSPQFQWFKNGNLVPGATAVSYATTGITQGDTFYCRMTSTGVCAGPLVLYSPKIGLTVLQSAAPPIVNVNVSPGTLLSPWQMVTFAAVASGNSGTNPQYQWKRNGSNIIGATSSTWSANNLADNDEISCVVTSNAWCADPASVESNKTRINIKTAVHDVTASRYKLYPNPVANELTIEGESGMQVSILNLLGQELYKHVLGTSKEVINISQLTPGHYLLQLKDNDGRRSLVKLERL
ncbi:T9SS type A sorting domain-containing protein [Polluticoccus soli]|uniref:Ig-like domain-containing protein n=1 Tax=Polluticoccus soli TaxID=3034150 RepID=UPI0023E31B80|nr:T9SS type A sorting domain-containing protein [Flavipsychrobacter sp. JY13-12]